MKITGLQNKELERTKSSQTDWGLRRSIQCYAGLAVGMGTAAMRRAIVLLALSSLSVACFLPFDTEPHEGPSLLYLVPEDFSGWSCTDFGVVGAPPLEQEGASFIIRPKAGEVLETSHSKKDLMFAKTESYFEGSSPRRPFPIERLRSQSFQEDTNHPVARQCILFGRLGDDGEIPDAPELKVDERPKKNAA